MVTETQQSPFRDALIHGRIDHISPSDQHDLIINGILFLINKEPSEANINLLAEAVLKSEYPEIANSCLLFLSDLGLLGNQDAVEILFNLAIENNHGEAASLIMQKGFSSQISWKQTLYSLFFNQIQLANQADLLNTITQGYRLSSPGARRKIISILDSLPVNNLVPILKVMVEHDPSSLQPLLSLYPSLTKEEKQTLHKLLEEQASQQSALISNLICNIFVLYEDELALNLSIQCNLTPTDSIEKAVFLFLSNQWDLYQKLDFNRALISSAYEKSSEPVRKRLLNSSRESGINDWLANLSQRSQSRWLDDMRFEDWMLAIKTCQENMLWPEMWKLCLSAPPFWSRQMIETMKNANWRPDEDAETFSTLVSISTETEAALEIHRDKILHAQEKSITSVAFHPKTNWLAAGTKDQDILFWDVEKDLAPLPPLQGPVSLSRNIAFDPSGEYLVAVNIDNNIRIYHLPEGKLVKTLGGHTNLVRSLCLHPDGRTLFSADFDGRLITWRFPYGVEISRRQVCKGEIYALAVSPGGDQLFSTGACGHLHTWEWENWKEIKKLNTGSAAITGIAVCPGTPILIFYSSNHKMVIWNYETGKTLDEINFQPDSPLISSLQILSTGKHFLNGTSSGKLELRRIEDGLVVASANVAGEKTTITSLVVKPGDETCFSGTSDGKIYVWDLIPTLALFMPVKTMTAMNADKISRKIKNSISQNERKWLEFTLALYQWHRRFDIQISENKPISIGEFDIFI